ncbi:RHS repeat-associated core domain-containing protein [Streptomyces sp. NPDC085866]|uniref:RHS repeat-associated core domain-containing protein n=1 Tax=Streptomyces sp. NPDC085866 TaxID=3365736 RepID=UPI0037CFB9B2
MNSFGIPRPSPGQEGRGRRWSRRIAVITGLALLPGLLTPVVFADGTAPLGRPDVKPAQATKVRPFMARVNKKAAAEVRKAAAADRAAAARARHDQQRHVTWPKAGKAALTVPDKGMATAAPGSLPVTAAATGSGKQADTVNVEVLDQRTATKLDVKGVVLKVTGPTAGGKARLGVDYSAFASAYGGDWAGRLQLQRLDDCALNDADAAKCGQRTPLDAVNNREQDTISAPVAFGAHSRPMLLAVAAGSKSGAGDYKATPLSASSTWEAGGSSGSFTWSYPLRVPPAAAGPKPDLSISYDSGAVDGQTANSNNQGSQIGTGFDLTSSFIERKYGSCDDDGQDKKYDLCWKYDNASLVLNGKATELVKDDETGKWRLKDDDASTVTHSTGADNGDDDGEYWTVVTGDGTKFVFGLNKLDGAGKDDRTDSVWTVPVFGDDKDEPGYSSGDTFAERAKTQAWRWNLDYVEDTHGNASTYWYAAEHNNYDKLGDDNTGTDYVRGGYLKEIRYGQRADKLFSASPAASDKVVFSYDERCLASGDGCDKLTKDTRDNWPDVPFDAICKDGDKCDGNVGPSFFTRKRLTTITTYAWNAAASTPAFEPVDAWALKQLYLDPGDTGDSTDQSLWLDEIRHTGKRGTDLSLDPVKFSHVMMPNRVDGKSDDILPLNKPRLKTVTSETGAQTIVSYLDADCTASGTKPRVDENTKRCYPVYWSPNGEKDPRLDWFQKYPVSSVSTSDPQGGSEDVQHSYLYTGGGAWHYDEDPMTPAKERTWSVWRGYQQVTHLTGVSTGTQSKETTVYLRGMNGDRVLGPDGKTPDPDKRKTVRVSGIKADEITDSEPYAGFTRETVTYNGATEVGGSISDPWSKRTATQHKSYADTEAYYVRTAATHTRTSITSRLTSTDRIRTVKTTYDDFGMAETVEDEGDDAVKGDEKCTRTWYARNDDKGINSLTSRTRTVAEPCATADSALDLPADVKTPGDVISDTAVVYDDTTDPAWSATQKPTKGDATWTGRAKGYGSADAPLWQKVSTTSYDTLGRPTTVKDTHDLAVSSTSYVPEDTGPLTATSVENAKKFKTTSTLDFATGAALKVTDPNGKVTESEYDSLGRVTKVWLPNRIRLMDKSPNYVYDYHLTSSGKEMSWVSTGVLSNNGSGYNTSYEFYDSLLRSRQTQTPTPQKGRLLSLTRYDTRGLAVSQQADIWDSTSLPSSTPQEIDGGAAPIQTDTTYDGASRPSKAVTKVHGVTRWSTDTTYTGDTVATTAPAGGQAVAQVTDALGRLTQRREYAGPQPTGTDYTTTDYTYTPAGQQKTVTGPDKTKWSYTYDLFGRQVSSTDPDKGKAATEYNDLDQVVSTTPNDDATKKLLFGYDQLGRKTGLWQKEETDANKLAAWSFDELAKGQQDTATRYVGGVKGKAYTQKVTAYDAMYHVTGSDLLLPDTEPLVSDGYVKNKLSFSTGYNLDGSISQYSAPAVGGLPFEGISYTFNALGGQLTAKGTTGYLQGAAFSPEGDLRQLTLGMDGASSAKKAYLNWDYEEGTRRLTRSYVTDDVHGYMPQELKFTQDDAGNVTSIFDATTQGGTAKADYQCFAYDGNRRMTEAWTPKTADCSASGRTVSNLDGAAPYWTSYNYTGTGQRKTETQHTTSGDKATSYTYDDPADTKPHTLDKTTGARAATYSYDSTGNTTSRPGPTAQQTLAWNTEGDLAKLTEGTKGTSYLYDAGGDLLIRRAKGDGETVLYLGADTELHLTTKGTTKTVSGTRSYTANGQTIAVRTATSGVSGSKLSFLAADHHGTSSIALDATTYAITKRYSTPFGAPRGTKTTSWPDDKAFLGKPADDTTGLTHVGAREYDPVIGQFISVDPVLSVDQHQSLNGYSYASNTPVTASDPTGLCRADQCGVGTPKGDGSGDIITDGPIDPGNPSAGSCHHGHCGKTHYNNTGTSHTSSSGHTSDGVGGGVGGGGGWSKGPGDSKIIKTDGDWLYGPQPEMGFKEFFRKLVEGPVCNPGYPCEDMKIAVVPVGEGPLGGRPPMPGPRRIPMGFPNGVEFTAFKSELAAGLKQAGYEDVTPIMQGSSVTGKSFRTGRPFGSHSDFDVALASSDLLRRAKQAGVELRSQGTRTGPLEPADIAALGLRDLSKSLSKRAGGRDVHFMVYGTVEGATSRAPSIIMEP